MDDWLPYDVRLALRERRFEDDVHDRHDQDSKSPRPIADRTHEQPDPLWRAI